MRSDKCRHFRRAGWKTPPPPPGADEYEYCGPGNRGLYRSRRGKVMGVCQGLADRFGVKAFWVRIIVILLAFSTGFWPVLGIYLIVGFLMRPEPVQPLESEEERRFYRSYIKDRSEALGRVKTKFEDLDRRIRSMEDRVTSREYDWDRRMGESNP